MSVIGFDIGNESCVIAAAKRGGIDVLLNDEAKRESPSVVSFGAKQRFLGSAGAAFATANPKSTISQIKRLIGRQYKEPSVQDELRMLPFVTSEAPRGGILIELEYLKQKQMFTPVEILGMLFKHLKQIAEKNLESAVVDCVIGIPSYFTDLQRREYLDAATISGLKPLMLMHDGTATALGYGMYKTDLSDEGATVVVFVDIGHCDTQVTVVAFEQGEMNILSHSFDQNLGGRDFDEILFKHFAAQFKKEYNTDVYSNARASIRLRASCEKLKKVLSANTEATLSIECLIEDIDIKGIITREEFECLSGELLERVTIPCNKAVHDSGISADKIHTIELVGSGSRIPAISKKVTSIFHKEPTRTLNASECVARGCALRCAMLSPTLKVQDYEVRDFFPYSIILLVDEGQNKARQTMMLFPKGSHFPENKVYNGVTPLHIEVFYTNKDFPARMSRKFGHFKIGPPESSGEEKVSTEYTVQLNQHGIVEIKSAIILDDKNFYSYLEKMMGNSHVSTLPFSENLDVSTTEDELREAQEREQILAEQDTKVEQTKDQRNTLESFVYDTRRKLNSSYRSFATDEEKDVITKHLQITEDWLYEDSDDEYDEQDYTGKLGDLKKLLDPIEKRYKDKNDRAKETKAMLTLIKKYRSATDSMHPMVKQEVNNHCLEAEQCLNRHLQQESVNNMDPTHWSIMKQAMHTFESNCMEATRPKPTPRKHDEHLDSDHSDLVNVTGWEEPVNLNRMDGPVNSNQRDGSVNSNRMDGPMNSNRRNGSVNNNKRDGLVGLNHRDVSAESNERDRQPSGLNQRDRPMGSNQRDQTLGSNQRYRHVDFYQSDRTIGSNKMDRTMGANQRDHPVDSNQRDRQPSGLNQRDRPMGSNQRDQTLGSNQRYRHVDFYQSDRTIGSNKMDRTMGANQRDHPVDSNQRYRTMGLNKMDRTMGVNQRDHLAESNQRDHHQRYRTVCSNKMDQTMGANQRDHPLELNKRDHPVDSKPIDRTMGSNKMDRAMGSNQRDNPMYSDKRDHPVESNQRDHPVDLSQMDQPVTSDIKKQPLNSNIKEQPVNSAQQEHPLDSDKKDLQDHMEIDE